MFFGTPVIYTAYIDFVILGEKGLGIDNDDTTDQFPMFIAFEGVR